MAAILPLSADEAYYLLWSHHLQAGYFDHPPAIAFLIRAGTLVFGDTPLGVRAMGLPLSLLTTWFVWQAAGMFLKDDNKAALAGVLFNLTLMVNVALLAATPDMPSIATVAAFVWAIAKLQTRGEGHWWLAAGAFAGLSLLSKYSMLFVGLGTAAWLLADARGRAWLKTPWPWLGGLLALAVFSSNLAWQAEHGWETFVFQFGRMGQGALTWRYLAEFAGAQLGLVTPLILVLAAIGFLQARRPGGDRFVLFVIVAVALLYFLQHALHDRVQGNWPCFLMPVLAIFAADGFGRAPRFLSWSAAPLAGVMLLALYLQAALGIIPLKRDPVARLLARDFPAAAAALAQSAPGGTIVTTDYETTALLRYWRPEMKVVQLNEPWRYDWASAPPAAWFKGQTVYFVETRRDQAGLVKSVFAEMTGALAHPGGYQSAMVEDPVQARPGKVP